MVGGEVSCPHLFMYQIMKAFHEMTGMCLVKYIVVQFNTAITKDEQYMAVTRLEEKQSLFEISTAPR